MSSGINLACTLVTALLTPLPRNAFVSDLLRKSVQDGRTGLKSHGANDKLDNNTCLGCFAGPAMFQQLHSLYRPFIFFEESKALGCSSMHIKIRYVAPCYVKSAITCGIRCLCML